MSLVSSASPNNRSYFIGDKVQALVHFLQLGSYAFVSTGSLRAVSLDLYIND